MLNTIRTFLSKIFSPLTLAVLELIIGLFLLISPSGMAVAIFLVCGLLLIVNGVVRSFLYFKEPVENAKKAHKLTTGLLVLVLGLFILFNGSFVVGIFPVLAALYAVLTMIVVFLKLEVTVTLVREKKHTWYIVLLSLVCSLIAMMVLFGRPKSFVGAGILFFIAAAVDLFFFLIEKGKVSVPTVRELFGIIAGRITKKTNDKNVSAAAQPVPASAPANENVGQPDNNTPLADEGTETTDPAEHAETTPAEPAAEEVDPADEDMSWANVPQIQMPE